LEQKYSLNDRPELNSLIAYCNEVILPKFAILEERRLEIKRKRLVRAPVYTVAFIAMVLIIAKVTGRNSHLGWKHTADLQKSTDFYLLNRNGFVPKWSHKSYEDKIIGEINKVPFTAHEIHLTHGSGDSEVSHDLFLIKVASGNEFSGMTHVRTKKSKLDFNKNDVRGLDRVKFVSPKFGKLFDVFSTDAIEAQYLLPPNYIETLTIFKEELEGKRPDNIYVSFGNLAEEITQTFSAEAFYKMSATLESITFMDGHIYIILGASNFFEIKQPHLDLNDPMHIDAILNEIELIFRVFDYFKPMMKTPFS